MEQIPQTSKQEERERTRSSIEIQEEAGSERYAKEYATTMQTLDSAHLTSFESQRR
jgi:hypothetical protein